MRTRDLLLFGTGTGTSWAHPSAVRALDYKNNLYMRQGVEYAFADLASVTRAGTGWLDAISGVWSEFLAGVLRRTDRGAAIGAQFTNKIRNQWGIGGVPGTVGVLNKCTGYNAKPTVVGAGTTKGGNASATLTLVDKLADLQALAATVPWLSSYLANGVASGQVFKLDNSLGGSGNALVDLAGVTANTNKHSMRGIAWNEGSATGLMRLTDGVVAVGDTTISATTPTEYKSENLTPNSSTAAIRFQVALGGIVYFILFDLIEAATAAPVPTIVAGAAATGALPTNWVGVVNATGGIAFSFLGAGVKNGVPCADIRLSGTTSGVGSADLRTELLSNVAAAAGQAWGFDFYSEAIAGVQVPFTLSIDEYTAGSAYLKSTVSGPMTAAPSVSRSLSTAVLSSGTVGLTRAYPRWNLAAATAYDFTLRIYAPKLVQIATIEGPELVTNGDFASATGWTLGPNSTIGSGVLNVTGSPAGSEVLASQSSSWTAGVVHKVRFDVATISPSGVSGFSGYGGGGTHASFNTVGTKVDYVVPNLTGNVFGLQARGGGGVIGTFDNLSLKTVTAGYMPAYPILPPVGVIADSTKLADDVRAANLDWFTAAGLSTGATELAAVTFSHVGDGVSRPLFEYSDGTANNYIRGYVNATDHVALKIVAGGVVQTDTALTASISATNKAYGFGWSAAGGYITNGTETVTFGAVTLPTVTQKRLGGSVTPNFLNDVIRSEQTCRPLPQAEAEAWALAA
tara:strand:- start:343 stop:2562 length:2220 start_codon:yes stop_codon:yes gene_type:complete